MNKQTNLLCVVALFLLAAVMNFAIHYNYPLPTHSDEYDHLAIIREMEHTGKHVWYDPYIVENRHAQRNLEINYDIFLYVFAGATGADLETLPLILPTVFSFLLSLSAFVLVYFLTKRDLAAFFAGAFMFFLPNSIAFLGYWFLVPMAIGLAALPLLSYLFLKSFHSWPHTLLLYLLLAAITLTHAVYTLTLLPAFLLFLLFSLHELRRRHNLLKLALGALLLFGLTTFFVEWNPGNALETLSLLFYFMVWPYGNHTGEYPLAQYIGPVIGFLAVAGALYLCLPTLNRTFKALTARFKFFQSVREASGTYKLPLLSALLLLGVRVYADYSGTCLLGPCRRTVPALSVATLLLAAIGFYAGLCFLNKLLTGISPRPYRIMRAAIFLLVLVFLLHQLLTMPFTYARDPVRGLYHNIEPDETPALAWVREFTKPDAVIFALPWTAKAVYLLAHRKVVDTGAARLGNSLASIQDIVNFFLVDCQAKETALGRHPADLIYAGKGYVDCPSLDLVLNSGGNRAYVQNT